MNKNRTFEEALKQETKAVSDNDVRDFLAASEAVAVCDITGIELAPGDPANFFKRHNSRYMRRWKNRLLYAEETRPFAVS